MRRLALVAVATLAIAGCGGGDDGGGGEGTAADTAAQTDESAALAAKAKRLIPIARQSQFSASRKESLRIANAQGELLVIAEQDPEAIAPLTAALEKPDYDLITDIYNFYIQLGRPGSEKVLVEALKRQEFSPTSSPMALAFLASGNNRLVRGARDWADENGLTITGEPGGVGPKWGQTGAPVPDVPPAPPPPP